MSQLFSLLIIGGMADLFLGACIAVLTARHKVYVAERRAWRVAEGLQMHPDDI